MQIRHHIQIGVITLALLGLAGCQSKQAPHEKITGLKTPESVIQAKDGRIYVSEINEFGKDGDGQIRLVDTDGTVSVFASGMDDPKGLAVIGDNLYVADKARILKVGPDGQWTVFVEATAFPNPPQFLNDLERDLKGEFLYVSDSGDLEKGGAIYRISLDGEVNLVIDHQQDARILAPNGLLMDDSGDVLLFVDFASGVLYSLNMVTGLLTDLAEGFGGGDGLVHHPNGLMYVSDWKGGKVFSVKHDELTLVKDGFQAAADIALTQDGEYILVPDMKAGELVWVPVPEVE
jgi:gluconolactonase